MDDNILRYTLRVNRTLFQKFRYIADYEGRSANREIEQALENLKSKFDGQISFCGGVDTQDLLPNGTPEMVAAKVKELRTYFPTGLIVSPSHEGLQPDVPPVNIKALFDEANKIY